MAGKLYGVGVGPGDPELVTIKARRILNEVEYIAIPKSSTGKDSVALSIAEGSLEGPKKVIELFFPMSFDESTLRDSWDNAVLQIRKKLEEGGTVAFVTLGDPTVYSTYMYVHKELERMGFAVEIVPGITSFCASAARAGVSLGENRESIAIIPSAYECENFENILDSFDNIVLMKVARRLPELKEMLKAKGLADKAVLVSKCGFPDEAVQYGLDEAAKSKLSYFTTMIIKKNGVR